MNFKFLSFLFFSKNLPSPVTIVPGFGGSVIYNHENSVLWPPKVIDFINYPQYFHTIGVHYEKNQFVKNTDTKVGPIGDLEGIKIINKWLAPIVRHNYYDDLLHELHEKYCKECLYGLPYDFRIIGNKDYRKVFYQDLKLYFENLEKKHDKKSVIITHSFGGLVIHDFLSKQTPQWVDRYIRKVIFVSCPWGGTVNALKLILSEKLHIRSIQKEIFIPFIKYYSCLLLLLPNPFFNPDGVIYENKKNDVKIHEIAKYFKNDTIISNQKLHFDDMLLSLQKKPDVPYHIVFGTDNITPIKLVQYGSEIQFAYGNGDGVIEKESLLGFQKWDAENISYHILESEEHTRILKSPKFFKLLKSFLEF